ncbi:Terpene synthase [Macleaya cordata]|uniref:Terpene synthase n=1 Tax=Macleaya cordata TaxID=56857 RepID=A0A200QC75_MACCD|nr:Terpene synthase [Macleaya cordata]
MLKEDVRHMFDEAAGWSLSSLKLIDTIQRLGLNYHFEDEIKGSLDTIMTTKDKSDVCHQENDMYTRALRFRLLRQHGYEVSQDVFKNFKEEMMMRSSDLIAWTVRDVEGMLRLYEALFYAFEGEEILDEAQKFTTTHLKEQLIKANSIISHNNPNLSKEVSHALELPLHWRVPRAEARWFIDTYKTMQDMDPSLLEFARLDFNMVQATYQEDLKYVSRWWRELGLPEALGFARDRLVENFIWAVGFNFEPRFRNFRRQLTKVNSLVTTIDDIYDVYGSLDELKLFTDGVQRWDINTMADLPDYMKICFLALYDTTNEMAYHILRKHGVDSLPYLRKAWVDLCKAYMVEANWYNNGYTPTLEEYMNNAWISISGPTAQTHAYFLLGDEITNKGLECLKNGPDLMRSSSMIFRLADDLGTSTDELERGDVPKSIQCYMHHTGSSERIAREHIKNLINDNWKKMNMDQAAASCKFPRSFINTTQNIAQTAQWIYQYGDGYGVPDSETKDWIMSIVVEPIPFFQREIGNLCLTL